MVIHRAEHFYWYVLKVPKFFLLLLSHSNVWEFLLSRYLAPEFYGLGPHLEHLQPLLIQLFTLLVQPIDHLILFFNMFGF